MWSLTEMSVSLELSVLGFFNFFEFKSVFWDSLLVLLMVIEYVSGFCFVDPDTIGVLPSVLMTALRDAFRL